MLKITSFIIGLILFGAIFVQTSFAAAFLLTKIGNLDTGGKKYSQWWYSGTQPTLVGTAEVDASVAITIDADTKYISADKSGNWTYTPPALSVGDHKVILASNGVEYTFTLTTGSAGAGTAVGGETKGGILPEAGSASVIGLLGAATALISIGIAYGNYKEE